MPRLHAPPRADITASLVVFLVAVPLSLGIAIASGAPIMAGLIAAAVGGIVAGALGGSPLQVSGPAAGLTVIMATLIADLGWKVTCAVTVGAGLLQLALSASRVARSALAISPVVVHAMLAGIGITIVLQQLQVVLGSTSGSTAWANLTALPGNLQQLQWAELAAGLAVIVIIVLWRRVPTLNRALPAPLIAIVAVTAGAFLLSSPVVRVQLDGSILDAVALPALPDGQWGTVLLGVLTVGIVASVESLLSAVAIDRLHDGPRTNFDRELMGQGAANVTSGMLGGLPVTGVIVRSSANVQAGARTRASAILHGVWVVLFSIAGVGLIEQVPLAALAGLLIMVGIQLVKPHDIALARRTGDVLVYAVTVLGVVFLNLLEGVAIGLALAAIILLWRVSKTQMHADELDEQRWQVHLEGSCSFLALPRLSTMLGQVPQGRDVVVDLDVDFLDQPFSQALSDWAKQYRAAGGSVSFVEHEHPQLPTADQQPPRRTARQLGPATRTEHVRPAVDISAPGLPVLCGVDAFHRREARRLGPVMRELANGQAPHTLFLTCADSRIVPNVITSTGPGELFTVRNVGNLVPDPHDTTVTDTSMEAALEFAIDSLGVTSVVVCGHSGCGAMTALLRPDSSAQDAKTSSVSSWLQMAAPSLSAYVAGHPVGRQAAEGGFSEVDQLSMVNLAGQLGRLGRHPLVGEAAARGELTIAGLWLDIPTARVLHVTTTNVVELAPMRRDDVTTGQHARR